jgi:uncharacterized protein YaaQ
MTNDQRNAKTTQLILAVVPDDLANAAGEALVAAGCGVTRISSTGGLLHAGSTTLLAGGADDQLEPVLEALRGACRQPSAPSDDHHRATVYVLGVARSERL